MPYLGWVYRTAALVKLRSMGKCCFGLVHERGGNLIKATYLEVGEAFLVGVKLQNGRDALLRSMPFGVHLSRLHAPN